MAWVTGGGTHLIYGTGTTTLSPQWSYTGSSVGYVTADAPRAMPVVVPEDEVAWLRRRVDEVTRLVAA